jgi:hypothetical protein
MGNAAAAEINLKNPAIQVTMETGAVPGYIYIDNPSLAIAQGARSG